MLRVMKDFGEDRQAAEERIEGVACSPTPKRFRIALTLDEVKAAPNLETLGDGNAGWQGWRHARHYGSLRARA